LTQPNEKPSRALVAAIALGCALALAFLASLSLGRYHISASDVIAALTGRMDGSIEERIVLNLRLPRILAAILVGACLSVAGACFQGIFHNPMASPEIVGASRGAGFGACVAILMGLSDASVTAMAFTCSLGAVGLAIAIAKRSRGDKVYALILSGIIVGSLCDAGISFMKLVADPFSELPEITFWLIGSLSGVGWKELFTALLPASVGLVLLMMLRFRLNVLSMSEDEALSMGVSAGALRVGVICLCALMSAACVSMTGMIGWIGLVVPHMARKGVGSGFIGLLPVCALAGGLFLLIVDDVSRTLLINEIPIGILTAVIGAPFFLYLLYKGRGGGM